MTWCLDLLKKKEPIKFVKKCRRIDEILILVKRTDQKWKRIKEFLVFFFFLERENRKRVRFFFHFSETKKTSQDLLPLFIYFGKLSKIYKNVGKDTDFFRSGGKRGKRTANSFSGSERKQKKNKSRNFCSPILACFFTFRFVYFQFI